MPNVFMNASIRNRGISGASVIVDQIEEMLDRQSDIVLDVQQGPKPITRPGGIGRTIRLVQSVWWDCWAAGRRTRTNAAIYPTGVGGWFSRSDKNVLVIFDLMLFDKSLKYDRGFRLTSALTWPVSAYFADVIVAPSEWTRREIGRRWPWALKKIVVVPLPCRLQPRKGPFKQWERHRRPNVVMISAVEPHKNHVGAISVVEHARESSGVDFSLTIVGPTGRAEHVLRRAMARQDPSGTWIERRESVEEEELLDILDSAFILLNTSSAEGFGLPLLEAAARDLPVVHSRAGSMNEVIPITGKPQVTTLDLAQEIVCYLDQSEYRKGVDRGRKALARHTPEEFECTLLRIVRSGAEP
jgi:glycosyltransferase involved in cell wall biosynthesis